MFLKFKYPTNSVEISAYALKDQIEAQTLQSLTYLQLSHLSNSSTASAAGHSSASLSHVQVTAETSARPLTRRTGASSNQRRRGKFERFLLAHWIKVTMGNPIRTAR